jgi:hypothetical protein
LSSAVINVEERNVTAIVSHLQCIILHVDHGVESQRSIRVFEYLSEVARATNCPLHRVSSQWIDSVELSILISALKHSVSGSNRTALLVCGSHLEEQVTVCSLEALLEGFDVHLLCDLIASRDQFLAPVLQQRLFQAGAVPSSLRQFLYMWRAVETDHSRALALQNLQSRYSEIFSERPA